MLFKHSRRGSKQFIIVSKETDARGYHVVMDTDSKNYETVHKSFLSPVDPLINVVSKLQEKSEKETKSIPGLHTIINRGYRIIEELNLEVENKEKCILFKNNEDELDILFLHSSNYKLKDIITNAKYIKTSPIGVLVARAVKEYWNHSL